MDILMNMNIIILGSRDIRQFIAILQFKRKSLLKFSTQIFWRHKGARIASMHFVKAYGNRVRSNTNEPQ